jgi:hypothetical protein
VLRLDYLSCVLTIASTILVGRRCWEGWALAGVNSILICVIGMRTEQLGFIPANMFCIVVSAINLRAWRRPAVPEMQNAAIASIAASSCANCSGYSAINRFSAKSH